MWKLCEKGEPLPPLSDYASPAALLLHCLLVTILFQITMIKLKECSFCKVRVQFWNFLAALVFPVFTPWLQLVVHYLLLPAAQEFWTGKALRLARLLSIICTVFRQIVSQMANISVIGSSILSPQLRIWVPREVFRWGGSDLARTTNWNPGVFLEPRGAAQKSFGIVLCSLREGNSVYIWDCEILLCGSWQLWADGSAVVMNYKSYCYRREQGEIFSIYNSTRSRIKSTLIST